MHNSSPSLRRAISCFTSSATWITCPSRSGWKDSRVASSLGAPEVGVSAKCSVRPSPCAFARANAAPYRLTSPWVGLPQRSTPTIPRVLLVMARSMISIASVAVVLPRSRARMRKTVILLVFALKLSIVSRIVLRYSSLVALAEGIARGIVRSSRYRTPSLRKSSSRELVA